MKLKKITFILLFIFTYPALAADKAILTVPTTAVTGNPLGVSSDQMVIPISILNGRELSLKRENTLAETLNSIPGVSNSSFGPSAGRPMIRGMDSDRIKILQNGVNNLDASNLSFDHGVSIDPLIIEQIDVIRGPATLLYGGGAVGGVVNAIDHRIPKEKFEGITGRGEVRYGGANLEQSNAAVVDVGTGNFEETNYPELYSGFYTPSPENEVVEANRGRVFYTSTDQSGNFRAGELFAVEQSTGVVTISADFFDLNGLSELRLGGIRVGGSGAVVREFSTDPLFTEDSNNVVPTQRAIRTYIASQIGGGASSLNVNLITAGLVVITGNTISTSNNVGINFQSVTNFTKGVTGVPIAMNYLIHS